MFNLYVCLLVKSSLKHKESSLILLWLRLRTDIDARRNAIGRIRIPPINVVYAYSCDTCTNGATDRATAFGIGADAVDRAYVGFDATAAFKSGVNASNSFWATLKAGKTVMAAMESLKSNTTRMGTMEPTLR